MQSKSFGQLPAFPMPHSHTDALDEHYSPTEDGMSYRQWLVGQVAGGLAANPSLEPGQFADMALQLANDIIERLDAPRDGA